MQRKRLQAQRQPAQKITIYKNNPSREISEFHSLYESYLTQFNQICDALYYAKDEQDKIEQRKKFPGLLQLIDKFCVNIHTRLKPYEPCSNNAIILELKARCLLARTSYVASTASRERYAAILDYADILSVLEEHLPNLDFSKDKKFQHEIHLALIEIMDDVNTKTLELDFSIKQLVYDFANKCTDPFVQMSDHFHIFSDKILSTDISDMIKKVLSDQFTQYYKKGVAEFETLKKQNALDIEARFDFIHYNYLMFLFMEKTYLPLRSINLDTAIKNKDSVSLRKYFNIIQQLKNDYLEGIINIHAEICFDHLTVIQINYFRASGKQLTELIKSNLEKLLKWDTCLNEIRTKNLETNFISKEIAADLENSRQQIIHIYNLFMQLSVFYSKFFTLYPEKDYCHSSNVVCLMRPKDNFQDNMETKSQIDQLIKKFEGLNIIKDKKFAEEKSRKLAISEESTKFLIQLEEKDKQFWAKRWEERNARKMARQVKLLSDCHPEAFLAEGTPSIEEIPRSKTELLIDQASILSEKHKFDDAIHAYKTAAEIAKVEEDVYVRLRALDGLAITYGNILLKELSRLFKQLESRTKSRMPLTREQMIALEVSVFEISYKLNYLEEISRELEELSNINITEFDDHTNEEIAFAKSIIVEMIQHAKSIIDNSKIKYQQVIKLTIEERKKFIIKLGKQQASHLDEKKDYQKLHELGLKDLLKLHSKIQALIPLKRISGMN